jgi:CubicO group peptidase (beta-lactamase class C family)
MSMKELTNNHSMKDVTLIFLFTFLALLTGIAASDQKVAVATEPPQQVPPLRLSEPIEEIVADLERFVPEYMREEMIPGAALALIRDEKVAWTGGFGIANTVTQEPITPETVFEVASNSKVVTAYLALRLVDQGLLSLDEPLNASLHEPWLPPSEHRDVISLRHVLSHSSGLGHSTTSRESLFAPGRGYSYSAIGYQYLQAVIEEVSGQGLEEIARQMAFTPLGMSSSSFLNLGELTPRTSNGHLHALIPASLFAVLYVIVFIVVGLIGLVILRIWKRRWRPSRPMVFGTLSFAFVVSLIPAFILFGSIGLSEFAWLIAFTGLSLAVAFVVVFLAGRIIIVRFFTKRLGQSRILMTAWGMLIVSGLVILTSTITNVPVPKWPSTHAEAAGSMRATVADMATFLIELSNPQHLSPATGSELRAPQIRLSEDLSWGLGPGIQHSSQGDALWQWGQHIDFQSLMVMYPEHGFGVVVCTNNDLLNPDVAMEIAHRALGGVMEPIRRALHLGFDYREGS